MIDTPDCLHCGACCAAFRVDFSVYETQAEGGDVPDALADPITSRLCRMRGTDYAQPRCIALTGKIGQATACGIYEWRPGPCRELEAGSDACFRARAKHGLTLKHPCPYRFERKSAGAASIGLALNTCH